MKRSFALLLSITLLLGALAASAQENPCFVGGYTDETNNACQYRAGIEIAITYPQWVNDADFSRAAVENLLSQIRDQFWEAGTTDLSTMFNPWFLQITYEDFTFTPAVRSVVFTISDYMGGAHPNSYFETFVFDFATEQELTLDDLFTSAEAALEIVSPLVQQVVIDRVGDEYTDSDWLADATGTNPDNYRNFVLTEDALIFYFPPSQLAAYAAGSFEVSVPLADLAGVLAPEFIGVG